jgi:hypothetical protein
MQITKPVLKRNYLNQTIRIIKSFLEKTLKKTIKTLNTSKVTLDSLGIDNSGFTTTKCFPKLGEKLITFEGK